MNLLRAACLVALTSLVSAQNGQPQISESINGIWQVYDGHWGDSEIWYLHIGELEITDTTYSFTPDSNAFISPQMSERFSFIGKPSGDVAIEYCEATGSGRPLDDEDILGKVSFNEGEAFLIRADYDKALLYFHSATSEVQLFRIIKSLVQQE
ncbi:hypothetical protein JXM67_06270 [candidate division WOR-3 bacterium]|nr:hypothetical protein [candidate division WOR-3 bacterium]